MLTVLIATHNGARTLPVVLEAYLRLQPPAGGWKLVVVDNASEDGTGGVLRSFAGRLPLRDLHVDRQGQNIARNRGLEEAEGDLLVFGDDDAVPREDWLVRMRAAADTRPGFGIFAGAIRPRWEVPPEPRLLESVPLAPCFAITDPAWEEGPVKTDFAFSPNMAIRREIFQAGYRFEESIGPRPGSYAMGSETELTRRLNAAGIRAWHVTEAVVEHMIRGFQMTEEWVLARAIRYGRGKFHWRRVSAERPPARLPEIARLGRDLLGSSVRIAQAHWRQDRRERLRLRWYHNCLVGSLAEALKPSSRIGSPGPRTPFRRSP